MMKLTMAALTLFLTFTAHAQTEDEMSTMARPRPRPAVHKCCAKPALVYGFMNCVTSTDRLYAWGIAVNKCENRYGNGACVSGCRRVR